MKEIQAVMNSHLGWQDLGHVGSIGGHGGTFVRHGDSVVGLSGSIEGGGHGGGHHYTVIGFDNHFYRRQATIHCSCK